MNRTIKLLFNIRCVALLYSCIPKQAVKDLNLVINRSCNLKLIIGNLYVMFKSLAKEFTPPITQSPIAQLRITQSPITNCPLPNHVLSITQSPITSYQSPNYQLLITFLLITSTATAQQRISFNAAFDTALLNNLQIRSSDIQIQRSRTLQGTWLDIPRTGVFAENEDLTPRDPRGILKIGLSQSIEWPGLYKARKALLREHVKSVEITKQVRALQIKRELQTTYYNLWYLQSKQNLWQRLDSIYTSLARAAVLRVKTGESAGLDSLSAMARARETTVQLNLLQRDIQVQQESLKRLLGSSFNYLPDLTSVQKIEILFLDSAVNTHPQLQLQQQNISISQAEIGVQQQSRKPNFEGRFFSQRLYGLSNPFSGFSVSVGIPLFASRTYKNRVRAAELESSYQQNVADYERLSLTTSYNQAYQQIQKDLELLRYYESTGLSQANAIIKSSNLAYRGGEINFAELSQYLTQAIDIQKNYLEVLNQYNQSAIQLNYYKGL